MARNSTKFRAVILAGGSGERFWPLSTPENPKQFLDVFGGKSLIRQSVARLKRLVAPEDVFIVTSAALAAKTRRELPELPRGNIVGEPVRRDTGAAVALSAGLCLALAAVAAEPSPDALSGIAAAQAEFERYYSAVAGKAPPPDSVKFEVNHSPNW